SGVGYTRPWLFVLSDGCGEDEKSWMTAVQECRAAEASKRCIVFPIAVSDARVDRLQQLSSTPVMPMSDSTFSQQFRWVSTSFMHVGTSRSSGMVQLPSTDPWAIVR